MPATATHTAKEAAPKPVKRPIGKSRRNAVARREIAALSDRIDRDLEALVADTDRLMAQVMRP